MLAGAIAPTTVSVTPDARAVRLPVYAFPAWRATVNGAPAQVRTDPETGLASVTLLKGSNGVSLNWTRLPQEWVGIWLSLLAAAAVMVLVWWRGRPGQGSLPAS